MTCTAKTGIKAVCIYAQAKGYKGPLYLDVIMRFWHMMLADANQNKHLLN